MPNNWSDPSDYLQNALGVPVTITSGMRTPQHNALVGGVPNSDHLRDQAYDFVPQGMSMADAATRLKQSGIPTTKIINENDHIHVSYPKGQMAQPGISDADLLSALTGGKPAGASNSPSSSEMAKSQISDADLLKALTSSGPSKPNTAQPTPQTQDKTSGPSMPFGFMEDMQAKLPFGKDAAAAGAEVGNTLGSLLSGKGLPKFGEAFNQTKNQLNSQQQEYEAQHPLRSAGALAASIAASGSPSAIAGSVKQGLGGLMKAGAKTGATLGGLFGVGQAPEGQDSFAGRAGNALEGATVGGVTGGAIPVGGAVIRPVGKALGAIASGLGEKTGIAAPNFQTKAQNMLLSALERDQTPASSLASGASGGKPLTAMDLAGTNTQRLARNIVTHPGQAGDTVTKFLSDRSADQSGRVLDDITAHLSKNTDVYGMAEGLAKQRQAAAEPLYKEAFAGGSTAPLEDQFRSELMSATGAKGTIAKQIKSIEANNPGALAARGAAGSDTRAKYMDLHEQLKTAEASRQQANEVFQKAKQDGSANAPGAVWNPRIQQFIDDPIIKQGINKGIEVQRLEALASGKKFNPTEYALTGTNADGTPKVGSVPNMRLLDSAKGGLDDILEEYRDKTTGILHLDKRGRAIDQVRRSLIGELDSLNPKYKEARAAWAGPSQAKTSMQMGENFLKADPEEIQQIHSRMSDGDRDFYKIGAARAIQDKANSAADSADLSKRLFGNARVRKQIETAFGKGAADNFGSAMGAEGKMASTNRFVLGGSNTANKMADAEDGHLELAQDILHGGLHGGPTGAVTLPAVKAMGRGISNLFSGLNPEVANHLAKSLTATGPGATDVYNQLVAAQAARNARSAGNRNIGKALNRLGAGASASAATRRESQR